MAWSDTVDGVYTPLGCSSGSCGTVTPATIHNLPISGYANPGTPYVFNVGGSTGTNYIYVYSGRGDGGSGANYSIYTTPASSANTTAGNTLTFLQDGGFTLVSGIDWEQPTTGTQLVDVGVFLNHCGFYEMYFTFQNYNNPPPSPPFLPPPAGNNPDNWQIFGEAVSATPIGPWYQLQTPVTETDSGDPAPIEINGQFQLLSPYNAGTPITGAGYALIGPYGTCP